jgi:hypothetical protein
MMHSKPTTGQLTHSQLQRDPYIDCKVRKKFGRKYYMGTVDHAWFGKDSEIYYHVIYEDNETEDLVEEELKKIIFKEPQPSMVRSEVQVNSIEGSHTDADIAEYHETSSSENCQQHPNWVDDFEYYDEDTYDSPPARTVNATVALGREQTREVPIHKAYKKDREKWDPIVQKLLATDALRGDTIHRTGRHQGHSCRCKDLPIDYNVQGGQSRYVKAGRT